MLKGLYAWVIGVGYVGQHLLKALQAHGADSLGIDLKTQGDAADPRVLSPLIDQHGLPQLIFCTQATSGGTVGDYKHAFLDVLQNLTALAPEAKLVFCSSSSVYGGQEGSCVNESSPCLARGERAAVLLEAEQHVLKHGGVVARLAAIYGPQRSVLLSRYKAGMIPLPGPCTRLLNYIHRDDAVRALLLLSTAPSALYNVCGECLSKTALLDLLAAQCSCPLPTQEAPCSRRGQSNQRVSTSALKALGWSPQCSLADFLREGEQDNG